MIVVTGAGCFIGSCIITGLNERGEKDILAVDGLEDHHSGEGDNALKKNNLTGKKISKYLEKDLFLKGIESGQFDSKISCIIHMGACSSTTCQDAQYFEVNNFQYTKKLAQWALKNNVRFIYASSAATYGDGADGYKDDERTVKKCSPLNLYGHSKQKFDIIFQGP